MESINAQALADFRADWQQALQGNSTEQVESGTATANHTPAETGHATGQEAEAPHANSPSNHGLASELTTNTTTAPEAAAWLMEAQVVHDFNLAQNLAEGYITVRPATINDAVRKHDLPPLRVRTAWKKGKTANVYSRQPGKADHFLNAIPVAAARIFSTVIDNAITRSGLPSHKVNTIIVPVVNGDQLDALAPILLWQKEIIDSNDCRIIPFRRFNQMPIYRYYRLAQMFRALAIEHQRREMIQRIQKMRYRGGLYRTDIDDIKKIVHCIPPEHDIRRGVIESIAEAWIDRHLRDEKDVDQLWSESEEFRAEIDAAVEEASKERGKKAKKAAWN